MSRSLRNATAILITLSLIFGPVSYAFHLLAQTRNFRVVREGVLYRSGQITLEGLKRLHFDYGLKTVICLREKKTAADQAEEDYCNAEELNFVRIPPNHWGDEWGAPPAEEGVRKFREVLSDPRNHPVLVHCLAGIHRTGIFTAIYRMEFEHWSNADAMAEMRACGYVELDEHIDVLSYLEQYRPSWRDSDELPPPSPLPTKRTGKKHNASGLPAVIHKVKGVTRPHRPAALQGRPADSKRSPRARPAANPPNGGTAPRRTSGG
jgi:tyrosine-protein phosphatase SIW14